MSHIRPCHLPNEERVICAESIAIDIARGMPHLSVKVTTRRGDVLVTVSGDVRTMTFRVDEFGEPDALLRDLHDAARAEAWA